MKVSEIMSRDPVTVDAGATLDDAVRLLEERGVRHLPVTEGADGGKLVGVVSERDLLRATGCLPARVRDVFDPGGRRLRVRDVMTRPAVCVRPDVGLVSACLDLRGRRLGCLPVVEGERLVGVITERDLLQLFVRRCARGEGDGAVAERMATGVAVLPPDATLERAEELMRRLDARHVPVVEEGRLLGIVSDRDLRRAAGAGRPSSARVDRVMTREVVTVAPRDRLCAAAQLLHRRRIGAVPVVDDGRLVGILTTADVLEHCLAALSDPQPVERSEP